MTSNSQRVTRQLVALPVSTGVVAAVLWPSSYLAAQSTGWLSSGTFGDLWFGSLAVVTFIGAVGATIACVLLSLDSIDTAGRE